MLAARYTDRSLYLIGPAFFLVWKRMLLTLLPIVVPIVAIVGMAAKSFAGDAGIGDVVAAGITAAVTRGHPARVLVHPGLRGARAHG